MREHPELGDIIGMLKAIGWPAATVGRRPVRGEAQWLGLLGSVPTLMPNERHYVARLLRHHLLCVTHVGRRRLRQWLDGQWRAPSTAETPLARRQRIEQALAYYGDDDLAPLVVEVLAGLPRPVSDYVLTECMFVTGGYSTAGWTAGRLPPRLTIHISGHRADAEIARTIRHEAAHRWLLDHDNQPARTYHERRTAIERLVADIDTLGKDYGEPDAGRRVVTAFVRQLDLEADWLAWSMDT